ncbi:MAG: Kae1-associated kinase Bud32 [Desulfurococcaceae archaeon TW002]
MTRLTCPGSPEVVALGAEAVLIKACFEGLPAIYKVRVRKSYRDKELDSVLIRGRSEVEAKIMAELRLRGLNVPAIYYVDVGVGLIVMEFVEGVLLRDLIRVGPDEALKHLENLGELVARIHEAGIVHGDITTSNVVVRGSDVYLIDFGLARYSRRLEDLATDLHLFIRSVESTHYGLKEALLRNFVRGYARVLGREFMDSLLLKVREIRMRGRYVEERRVRRGT